MIKLTTDQMKLAEQLLITVKKREPIVEYKELGDRVSPPIHHRQVPRNIEVISELCFQLELPFLSAKVVTKGVNEPGIGFYKLYTKYFPESKNLTPKEVFNTELKKIRECTEWYKLVDYLHIDIDFPNSTVKSDVTPSIRILPMSSKEEFPGRTIEDVQDNFFLGELIKRDGIYYFRKVGMNAPNGSLVLFQFDNLIIASAKLHSILRYERPEKGQYFGAYKFEINTIKIFQPITIAEMNKIDSNINKFSQSKQEINASYGSEVRELIKKKQMTIMAEELPVQESYQLKEGAKKQVLVNSYERNYKARQICIEHYGCLCSVCGFDFAKFYGEEFKGKIHIHHLKALSEINGEYEVNPISDLRPVCPNCHLALHSTIGNKPYSIDELKAKINSNLSLLK